MERNVERETPTEGARKIERYEEIETQKEGERER
jgi:hypothetical protein